MTLTRAFVSFLLCSGLVSSAVAQHRPPSFEVSLRHDSGRVENQGARARMIHSFPVQVPGATWLRLGFSEIDLPERGARIVITSVLDGARQELSARAARQWRGTTAYFNGDDLQVELFAEPGSGPCRLVLSGATAGLPPPADFSQCDSMDDRVPSSDPRQGRVMPVGCTTWMIDDCGHNLLTAGHCSGGGLEVVEFNVPPSASDGTVQHPPPEDQYAVDLASKQWEFSGLGDDWGYYGVFANPVTGLRPFQRQQASYVLAASAPDFDASIVIRITGYGVDGGVRNQVQQTSSGPYFEHAGTVIGYRTDTEGGNSGSPVVWEQEGVAIGIHTHGGCGQTGGRNRGTAIQHPGLQAALANPLGECACRGEANTYCTGKVNSQGCLQAIGYAGLPSATDGAGSFVITGHAILNRRIGLLFYSYAHDDAPCFGGTRCIAGPLRRTPVQNSGGSSQGTDCTGMLAFDMGSRIASGADLGLVVGATAYAQFFSRDGASASGALGLTDAVQFTIGP